MQPRRFVIKRCSIDGRVLALWTEKSKVGFELFIAKCKLLLAGTSGQDVREISVPSADALARAHHILQSDPSIWSIEIWSLRKDVLVRKLLRLERNHEE